MMKTLLISLLAITFVPFTSFAEEAVTIDPADNAGQHLNPSLKGTGPYKNSNDDDNYPPEGNDNSAE